MSYFYTADLHLGHDAIRRFVNRPFASLAEQDETLISNWNGVVGVRDDIRHIGDFSYRAGVKYTIECLRRLKGRKHFILGNHDWDLVQALKEHPELATSVQHYQEQKLNKRLICMFHYALRTWHHDSRGAWMLFGHSHGGLNAHPWGKSVDVGVENWNYTPVSYDTLEVYFESIPIGNHPQSANYTPEDTAP